MSEDLEQIRSSLIETVCEHYLCRSRYDGPIKRRYQTGGSRVRLVLHGCPIETKRMNGEICVTAIYTDRESRSLFIYAITAYGLALRTCKLLS